MADFNIRSDSVNVEQIMQQIRAKIREKRGVDYTEQQIRELAAVKLERFLDPLKVRSGLLEQFRQDAATPLENYAFEDMTLFDSHRAPLRWIRRLLRPILKLFFNPNPLIHVLHLQAGINARHAVWQAQYTEISYELLHNLVLETTRLGIEVKNLTMRVESVSSRFDFAERRARALEGLVQGRPEEKTAEAPARGRAPHAQAQQSPPAQPGPAAQAPAPDADQAASAEARRRRRRRRGRRSGPIRPPGEGTAESQASEPGGRDDERPEQAAGTDVPAAPDREDQ